MSIADQQDMYIYPDSFPTNIANPSDLKILKDNFKGIEVYMVVGSDVILNASSYKRPRTEYSIHTFAHIIFERNKNKKLEDVVKSIEGEVHRLALPSKYSDISSTQIRNYIDENRDISSLVDPLAQQYIYENGFYQREPFTRVLCLFLVVSMTSAKSPVPGPDYRWKVVLMGGLSKSVLACRKCWCYHT
jgi:hypothetical protein